jgi:hypothetical protein
LVSVGMVDVLDVVGGEEAVEHATSATTASAKIRMPSR